MIASALICVASVIYHEARGEPYKGQVAVASVALNRADKNRTNVCAEINKQGQFPWARTQFKKVKNTYYLVTKIRPDDSWFRALALASAMINGTEKRFPNIISFDSRP